MKEDLQQASQNKLSINDLRNRVHMGFTAKRAVTQPIKRNPRANALTLDNRIKENLKVNNIPEKNYRSRIAVGWSERDAYTIPVGITRKKYYRELRENAQNSD